MNDVSATPRHSTALALQRIPDAETRAHTQEALEYLATILRSYQFELRDDSRLAFLWATYQLPPSWTEYEVCHEIMCQQWLCVHSSYAALSQPFMRTIANEMRRKYHIRSWATVWQIVRAYAPDLLKTLCLAEAGGQFPVFMRAQGYVAPIPHVGAVD